MSLDFDGAIRAFNEASREIEQLRKRLENAEREADTWWNRSETQVDIIADVRVANDHLHGQLERAHSTLALLAQAAGQYLSTEPRSADREAELRKALGEAETDAWLLLRPTSERVTS